MTTEDSNEIMTSLLDKYGSLEKPTFFFVESALAKRPYDAIVRKLAKYFNVEETTDPNEDVSFVFALSQGVDSWLLQLSMIGPYAIILGDYEVVASDSDEQSESEKKILEVLLNNNIQVLNASCLSQPVPLKLFNTDLDNVRVYQALFSDVDALPQQLLHP